MGKVTEVSLPGINQIDTYFVVSDWHSFYMSQASYNIFKKHALIVPREQRRLIIAGDFLDAEHMMGKPHEMKKWARDNYLIEDLADESAKEFEWGNKILDEVQDLFDYVYFIEGNHDIRYSVFSERFCPIAYSHNFDQRKRLDFKKRGIPFVHYNDYLDVGKLAITHGMFHGASHNKKHLLAAGKSVMYGHLHTANSLAEFTRGELRKAWSLPCMCGLAPDYVKNRDMSWTNGYGTVSVKNNGNFNVHIHEIFDEELILSTGELIRG